VAGGRTHAHPISVLIAERHHLVREALARLLEEEPGFAVAGHAGDGEAARRLLARHRPQALLLEPDVLGATGLRGLRPLTAESPATRVVVLTDEDSAALSRHAHDHGAAATVVKHARPDDLFRVVRFAVARPAPAAQPA
jgi:DNA-binding NarL/FixJ family response regulator